MVSMSWIDCGDDWRLLVTAASWRCGWRSTWSRSLSSRPFSVPWVLLPKAQRGCLIGTRRREQPQLQLSSAPSFRLILPKLWSLISHAFTEKYLSNCLLWTRVWTSSNCEHIQSLKNHIIKCIISISPTKDPLVNFYNLSSHIYN